MRPAFILFLEGEEFDAALGNLVTWVEDLLVPVYVGEHTSSSPWCTRWWLHVDAIAYLYSLWMAWQEMTSPTEGMCAPANWHRDYLQTAMTTLRDSSGPFAGCKPGSHRDKRPMVDAIAS
ncbi:DUF4913 domain-containing protein (plasmid) [Streptomyces sp. NBC_01497]